MFLLFTSCTQSFCNCFIKRIEYSNAFNTMCPAPWNFWGGYHKQIFGRSWCWRYQLRMFGQREWCSASVLFCTLVIRDVSKRSNWCINCSAFMSFSSIHPYTSFCIVSSHNFVGRCKHFWHRFCAFSKIGYFFADPTRRKNKFAMIFGKYIFLALHILSKIYWNCFIKRVEYSNAFNTMCPTPRNFWAGYALLSVYNIPMPLTLCPTPWNLWGGYQKQICVRPGVGDTSCVFSDKINGAQHLYCFAHWLYAMFQSRRKWCINCSPFVSFSSFTHILPFVLFPLTILWVAANTFDTDSVPSPRSAIF